VLVGHRSVVAPRFVVFAMTCAAWLAAMEIGGEIPLVLAAGRAWFMNWAVQIAVAVVSWNRPFSLPLRYYQPLRRRVPIWLLRLAGVRRFASIAHIINPHSFDRRLPVRLETALRKAETTHVITFVLIVLVAGILVARRAILLALCITVWNILFNGYPVAVQRHNRWRLQQLASRRARRLRSD